MSALTTFTFFLKKGAILIDPSCKIETHLFNKNLLISITRNKSIIDVDIMRDSFHNQASSFTHVDGAMKFTKNYEI
jgi:hypothetical protein